MINKVIAAMLVAVALAGCANAQAEPPTDRFSRFMRNPYPQQRHPGVFASPSATVDEQTYALPSTRKPRNAFTWLKPEHHLAQAPRLRCPVDSTYNEVFCAWPQNAWFTTCVNGQWLNTRYRNPRVWVVFTIYREAQANWLETYPQDQPDAKRCRIQLQRPSYRTHSALPPAGRAFF